MVQRFFLIFEDQSAERGRIHVVKGGREKEGEGESERDRESEGGREGDRDPTIQFQHRQPVLESKIYPEPREVPAMSSGRWKSVLLMVLVMGPRNSGGLEVGSRACL